MAAWRAPQKLRGHEKYLAATQGQKCLAVPFFIPAAPLSDTLFEGGTSRDRR